MTEHKTDLDLLDEHERQEAYLNDLPEDFQYPLFNGASAIQSQRKSGYKNTACAAREIVDNALEAGADNVWVALQLPGRDREQREKRDTVRALAFIDDGPGMISAGGKDMLRFSLSWGAGTHMDSNDPSRIGTFGFGLPNSSVNQTQLTEVYTRADEDGPWRRAVLDIRPDKMDKYGLIQVPEPEEAELPEWVQSYLDVNGIVLETGTVVVWVRPDNLSYRQSRALTEMLINDFGVTYRYLLNDFTLTVDETVVGPVDPLFSTPGCRYHLPREEGGAEVVYDQSLSVAYFKDEYSGERRLELLSTPEETQAAVAEPSMTVGVINVKLVQFPLGFALGGGYKDFAELGEQALADAKARFEIRKTRRGMSFVRGRRELETIDAFPKSKRDKASGLGDWPLLQTYAYHYGVEVKFGAGLDEVFAVGNDKQTVRPIQEFWKVLHEAGVDIKVSQMDAHQKKLRSDKKKQRAVRETESAGLSHERGTAAIKVAIDLDGKRSHKAPHIIARSKDLRAQAIAGYEEGGMSAEQALEAVRELAERKEYFISTFEAQGGVFFRPSLGESGQQIGVEINTAHPFFDEFYQGVVLSENTEARDAVDVLLLTLAYTELHAASETALALESAREGEWSRFLSTGLKRLRQTSQGALEAQDE